MLLLLLRSLWQSLRLLSCCVVVTFFGHFMIEQLIDIDRIKIFEVKVVHLHLHCCASVVDVVSFATVSSNFGFLTSESSSSLLAWSSAAVAAALCCPLLEAATGADAAEEALMAAMSLVASWRMVPMASLRRFSRSLRLARFEVSASSSAEMEADDESCSILILTRDEVLFQEFRNLEEVSL